MRGDGAGFIVDLHQHRTRGFDGIGWPPFADDGSEARIRQDLVEKFQACVGGLYGFAAIVEAGERVGPGVTRVGPVRDQKSIRRGAENDGGFGKLLVEAFGPGQKSVG